MTRDLDLTVSCECGQYEITKVNGYDRTDLDEALTLGNAAHVLCRHRNLVVYPCFRVAFRVFYSLLIALLAVANASLVSTNHKYAVDSSLQRAHDHYMRRDYDGARHDLLAVLACEPCNLVALDSIVALEGR